MGSSRALTLHRLGRAAVEVVSDCSLKHYNQFFLAERDTGGWKTATDPSIPNVFVSQTKFRMEKVMAVLVSIRKGDFVFCLDLKDSSFIFLSTWNLEFTCTSCIRGQSANLKHCAQSFDGSPSILQDIHSHLSLGTSVSFFLCRYLDDWLVIAYFASLMHCHQRLLQFDRSYR